jgi:septum formation protein
MRVILASKSPRRKEILNSIGISFEVIESSFEESFDPSREPADVVEYLSFKKAESVAGILNDEALVIGSDTVVVLDKEIMGKPQSEKHAYSMLKNLSGRWHHVYSGICVFNAGTGKYSTGFEKTAVKLKMLSDREIWDYIETGEPLDKAGGYAIQGVGSLIVEKIEGCYFNVVGLPVYRLSRLLEDFDVNLMELRG